MPGIPLDILWNSSDLWSKQEKVSVEESKQRACKKPLKNGFRLLYLSLTDGQRSWEELGHGRHYK
jgi:hypothetical protein